jgi:hypothetical protein
MLNMHKYPLDINYLSVNFLCIKMLLFFQSFYCVLNVKPPIYTRHKHMYFEIVRVVEEMLSSVHFALHKDTSVCKY